MKRVSMVSLLVLCLVAAGSAPSQQSRPRKVSRVNLSALDSYGGRRASCQVLRFKRLDFDGEGDYSRQFSGLIGTDIPYGYKYEAYIKCEDKSAGGPFYVTVGRQDKFDVLASWLNVGDYVTGPDPQLTVIVHKEQGGQLGTSPWIKLVGVYVNKAEVDTIDPKSQAAKFYEIVPGRYLLLLLTGDKVVCTEQIDLLEAPARLEVSISGETCKVEGMSSLKIF